MRKIYMYGALMKKVEPYTLVLSGKVRFMSSLKIC